ncbi:MAG: O-antigen ligase family protein [Deltaproteobacteria bacterium]|nr:O-antigen ligase family protein [Deltaproteobacteria bacterium]
MDLSWSEREPFARLGSGLWLALLGVIIGLLFLTAVQLDLKWFLVAFLGALTLIAALAFADRKSFFLVLLVFALPINADLNLFFQPSLVRRSTYGLQITLPYLALIPLYFLWGISCLKERRPLISSTTGHLPLFAFFITAFASVILSRDRLFGFFDLFALTGSILLFVYVANQVSDSRMLGLVWVTLMATVGIQGAIAAGQYLTGSGLGLEALGGYGASGQRTQGTLGLAAISRVAGTLGHPNQLALYFDLLLPLGWSFVFFPMRRRFKLVLIAVLVLGGVGLLASLSRGGITAVSVAFLFILLARCSKLIGLFRSGVALFLLFMFLTFLVLGTSNPIQERFLKNRYAEALARVPLAKVTLNLIGDNPALGVGLNNYTAAARRYDTTPEQITSVWNAPVHNLFLLITAETGVIGLAFFVGFLFTAVFSLIPTLRAEDPFIRTMGAGLFIGLLAYLAHVQIDYSEWTHFAPLWFLLGLSVSLRRVASFVRASRPPFQRNRSAWSAQDSPL